MTRYYPQAAMTLQVRWEDFKNEADPLLTQLYKMRITPKNVRVNINDDASADTFNAQIEYKSFPFDPRVIRALGVTIHMKNMEHIVTPLGVIDKINPGNQLMDIYDDVVFMGFTDEESIRFDDVSRTVSFEGRDYTALLIDAPFDMGSVDLFRPLTVVFRQILANLEATREIYVLNRTGEILPTIGEFAPAYTPLAGKKNKNRNESYWDVIQDLAGRAGLITYIELDKLVIAKPRNLYDKKNSKTFIYGKNVKNLEIKRKIGRLKDNNIRVTSLNLEAKEVIMADIPREATLDWRIANNLLAKDLEVTKLKPTAEGGMAELKEKAPFLVFRVPNIVKQSHLISIGEKTFEELSRQQLEGSFDTHEMAICDESNVGYPQEFDITKIRNGTAVEIEINNKDLKAIQRIGTESERVQYLVNKCYDKTMAVALAKTLGKFSTKFYTKAVELSFDMNTGFKMNIEFINWIDTTNLPF